MIIFHYYYDLCNHTSSSPFLYGIFRLYEKFLVKKNWEPPSFGGTFIHRKASLGKFLFIKFFTG